MKGKIGPLKVEVGGRVEVVVEPAMQARILNNYYSSVFSESTSSGLNIQTQPGRSQLTDVTFDKE